MFDVSTKYEKYRDCIISQAKYANNGHIALEIWNEEGPITNLTVNLAETRNYPENYGFVDTNNFPEAVELIERLGIGTHVGYGNSGFCTYPLYAFDVDAINTYSE